jgi:hypothetical protein
MRSLPARLWERHGYYFRGEILILAVYVQYYNIKKAGLFTPIPTHAGG